MSNYVDKAWFRDKIDSLRAVNNAYASSINESVEEEENLDNVPYAQNDQILQNITQICSEHFGAKFGTNPVLYSPSDNNVLVNGDIGGFENAKFSFRLNDSSGNGCYVWFDNLQLNDENLRKLQVIFSVYSNWKNEMLAMADYKPSNYNG